MARRVHHYKRSSRQETPELDMTTFMNLMVVLVPFLLITAVFSRITIVELDLPSSQSSSADAPDFRVEVVVRDAGLEIMDGHQVIAAIPNVGEEYDLESLSGYLVAIKEQYPDKRDASVLLEPEIAYDHLIQVMDTVRTVRTLGEAGQVERAELFAA
ncbi:MAG: ExbD/TolR family protein, partial [Steroidobacteraceae bacterium]